jgi:uncharacterized protein (DUF169 family)
VNELTKPEEYHRYGEELEKILMLKTSPVAVKMLAQESDIPAGAMRPKRDHGYHLAQCQAFALSRRDKMTIAMLKEDHWCPAALMAYGMVPRPDRVRGHPYDCFEYGKYLGIVTAPLPTTPFIPDAVIIYTNTAQLRSLLLMMKMEEGLAVKSHFFPPSCAYAVVYPILYHEYWIVLPDPGEFQRALTGEDEMMFALPGGKMADFISGLKQNQDGGFAYRRHHMLIRPDFPQPDFYQKLFRTWGLDVKEDEQWQPGMSI